MTHSELIKSMINNIINDRMAEATLDFHNIASAKMRELTGKVTEEAKVFNPGPKVRSDVEQFIFKNLLDSDEVQGGNYEIVHTMDGDRHLVKMSYRLLDNDEERFLNGEWDARAKQLVISRAKRK